MFIDLFYRARVIYRGDYSRFYYEGELMKQSFLLLALFSLVSHVYASQEPMLGVIPEETAEDVAAFTEKATPSN